jgi:L-asparaginase
MAIKPRLIVHGGAGNITRENLSREAYDVYAAKLRSAHRSTSELLAKGVTALDAATHAVTLFEDCPLFNCGKGAVS